MKPHSAELGSQILAACDENEATRSVTSRFKLSESRVRLIKPQRRERRPVARQNHSTSSAERGEDVCLQTICFARQPPEQTRKQTLIAQRPNRSRSRQTSWIRLNASTTEVWRLRLQEKQRGHCQCCSALLLLCAYDRKRFLWFRPSGD